PAKVEAKKPSRPLLTWNDVLIGGKMVANPGGTYLRYRELQRQREELERVLRLIEEQERQAQVQEGRQREELMRLWLNAAGSPRWFQRPAPVDWRLQLLPYLEQDNLYRQQPDLRAWEWHY